MEKLRFKLDPATGKLSEKDTKRYFSTVGLAVFVYMLATYLSATTASLILGKFFPSLLTNSLVSYLVSAVCQYGIALPLCLLILCRLPKDTNPSEPMGVGMLIGGLCVAFTFMSVGNSVGQLIILLFETGLGRTLVNPVASSTAGTHWIVNLVFVAIITPVMEELIFRKIICDRLLPLGEGYAVVISALIFGLAHGNFFQFFYAFLIGLLFSYIYVKTGRIRYSVSYHILINALGAVFVPWVLEKTEPILNEEMIQHMSEALESQDPAAMEALYSELLPYMGPVFAFSLYELVFFVASAAGIVILMTKSRGIKLREGLLPPPKEGRIANIFCNVGVAAAITLFAGIFLLSLL